MSQLTASRSPTIATPPTVSARRSALASLLVIVVTGALILGVVYLSNPDIGGTSTGDFTAVDVSGQASGAAPTLDQLAPDFSATTADGNSLSLGELRGQPVWLTFGASWCQPCRAENPDVMATYAAYRDRVAVVQVYMDEDAAAVSDYTSRVGIDYLAVPDPNERLAAEYRILGIPSHFFIDADGVLRKIKIGSLDPATMAATLDELLR